MAEKVSTERFITKTKLLVFLPLDSQMFTYLVGQYRFPIDQYSWEIPEGGCPEGSTPLEAAQRELEEETGLKAQLVGTASGNAFE